jgi:hypothetical protein
MPLQRFITPQPARSGPLAKRVYNFPPLKKNMN